MKIRLFGHTEKLNVKLFVVNKTLPSVVLVNAAESTVNALCFMTFARAFLFCFGFKYF